MAAALQMRVFRSLTLTLACVALVAALTGCQVNPVTGQQQLNFISRQQALSLGDEQHPRVVNSHNGRMDLPELNRYLTDIVKRLHRNSHTPDMPVDFTLLNSSVVNAFALPGHVYATRGFVAKVDNEAQFAAVMGHELAHVSAGHVAQQMSRQTLSSLGLSLAGAALGGDTAAAQGAMQAAKLGTAGRRSGRPTAQGPITPLSPAGTPARRWRCRRRFTTWRTGSRRCWRNTCPPTRRCERG